MGSNLGDRGRHLAEAIAELDSLLGPLRVASIYLTEPVSPVAQPDFYNTVLGGLTSRSAEELLALGAELERRQGRRPGPPLGPRPLDVDLLFLGDEIRHGPRLTLPHPRLAERRFVLAPLAEIFPDLPIPGVGRTPRELLAELPPGPRVERLGDSPTPESGPEAAC
ncbi:MAG: 2-amino-4-hydroxy-6-hydroxymethyldihydropteridine diphosphokinase [Thermoanaerobaculia bacterium]